MAEKTTKMSTTAKAKTTGVKTKKATPKRKPTAKKAPAKKASAKSSNAKRPEAKRNLRAAAVETGRNALRAGLGVYGKAYDQLQDQFEILQKQVDDAQTHLDGRRKQAEDLYDALVKRGEIVEKEALKAFGELELDSLTDRSKLEEQMNKAKSRFEALRSRLKKAA